VVQSAKEIGVTIKLTVESSASYYGKATFGNSDWLDATMSLVDYGDRSVPNVFLTAPLQTTNAKTGTGSWNAAHFSNSQYGSLVNKYIATVDLSTQRTIAGQIEALLLDQTPVIYGYFYNWLAATAKNVTGAYPTAIGHIFLYNATKSWPAPGRPSAKPWSSSPCMTSTGTEIFFRSPVKSVCENATSLRTTIWESALSRDPQQRGSGIRAAAEVGEGAASAVRAVARLLDKTPEPQHRASAGSAAHSVRVRQRPRAPS
jgi:hypothetical protein